MGPPLRVHRDSLVEVQVAHRALLHDLDELVLRVLLVEEPGHRLHGARRHGEHACERHRRQDPATPEQQGPAERDDDCGTDERALCPAELDRDDGRHEHADDAPDRRECIQASGHRPRDRDIGDGEPDRKGRRRPEQDDGRREEHERAEERSDDGSRRDVVQPAHRDVEQRLGGEGNDGDESAARHDEPAEHVRVRVPVGDAAAEPVADRERREDEADHVGPHDRRGAEVRREQPGGADLGRGGAGSCREHQPLQPGRWTAHVLRMTTTARSSERSPPANSRASSATAAASARADSSCRAASSASRRSSPYSSPSRRASMTPSV